MRFLKVIQITIFLGFFAISNTSAQSARIQISGIVKDSHGHPIPNATVSIMGTTKGAVTGLDGEYHISVMDYGTYTFVASFIGFEKNTKVIEVDNNDDLKLNFQLERDTKDLEEVIVKGESVSSEKSKEPITVTALDAVSLRNQAIGAQDVLKRSTGVLVRQQGGLGSRTALNLNGLTGNAVRVYYDGVPLQLYGGGIQINNLPVNQVERIEVYKGVMPITIGTDALGGGINIIPKVYETDYREASYETGSFNTHRSTISVKEVFNKDFSAGGNLFFNYSDNDYEMSDIPNQSIRIFENDFGRVDTTIIENRTDAERFNNRHLSLYAEGNLDFRNRRWADRLSLSTAFSYRNDEFQHGKRVTKRPAGEAWSSIRSFMQRINYRKQLGRSVNFNYFGMASLSQETVNDSTSNVYTWDGSRLPIENGRGAEILGSPSLREGNNFGTTHRLNSEIRISPGQQLTISDFFSYSRIEGEDPVGNRLEIGGELLDPNTVPSRFSRNIFGTELESNWYGGEKFTTTVFYKNYYYRARSIDITQRSGDIIPLRNNESWNHGFGLAAKYSLSDDFFVRSSFERTIRMPNEIEIYGNFLAILPNYTISPERSNNLNAGLYFQSEIDAYRSYSVDLNLFLRNQQDLIRLEPLGNGELARYINEDEATSRGAEVSLKLEPIRNLSFSGNVTFQRIALASSDQIQDERFIGVQIPNIPDLFFNTSVNYAKENLFSNADFLELYWNYYFVDQFSVTYVLDEKSANPQNIVPTQHQHNIGASYTPSGMSFTFSLQVNNVLNDTLYDNFRVPKPGIHYAIKVNYAFNN